MDRIRQLEEFLNDDPHDPFNTYALALEYQKVDVKKAYALFDQLLGSHPDYIPTYYTFAHLLIDIQQVEKAETVFKQGIEFAKRANDVKALRELTNAYNNWLFEQS